ncbi:MAG TPA: hypothetical protein EYO97_01845, partial [Gemmatimonadetes bacterium]|nr:hypothetical protein [Gemmatimonadota bacterium]
FKGHPVAAVAAISGHVAETAMALIEVDYEVLEAIVDVREAMNPNAPQSGYSDRCPETGLLRSRGGGRRARIEQRLARRGTRLCSAGRKDRSLGARCDVGLGARDCHHARALQPHVPGARA